MIQDTEISVLALNPSVYLQKILPNGETALSMTCRRAQSITGKAPVVLSTHALDIPHRVIRIDSLEHLIQTLSSQCKADTPMLLWDAHDPLLDAALIADATRLYRETLVDYIQGDLYPAGLAPILVTPYLLSSLAQVPLNESPLIGNPIQALVQKHLNRYDVELLLAEEDLRHLRLSVACTSMRSFLVVQSLISIGFTDGIAFSQVRDLAGSNPTLFRPSPAYVELEVTNECDHYCVVCPRQLMTRPGHPMPRSMFEPLIDELAQWAGEPTLVFGYMGEPFQHPEILPMIDYVCRTTSMPLLVETNGLAIPDALFELMDTYSGLHLLIGVDGASAPVHDALRPGLTLPVIERTLGRAIKRHGKQVHPQWVRVNSNESELYKFFDRWRAYENQIVILGYNGYQGRLPAQSPVDFTPLVRFPCVHLSRDMNILSDGRVVFCKQDVNGDHTVGQFPQESLQDLWRKMNDAYVQDQRGQLADQCKSCDQWFQFNE